MLYVHCLSYNSNKLTKLDATVSQVYYLTFSGSTCFWRLHAHHQELTTALAASGFTVGALVVAALLVVVWPVITGQTTTNSTASTTLQGKTKGC
jgi:hypothetical protein